MSILTNLALDEPTPCGLKGNPSAPSEITTWIGDHEILGEIARGGMGVVYHARQHRLNRDVALKVLHESILQQLEDAPASLTREAEAAALLDHPGIVPVFELGTHRGRPYFTMAFVDGKSLAQIVQSTAVFLALTGASMREPIVFAVISVFPLLIAIACLNPNRRTIALRLVGGITALAMAGMLINSYVNPDIEVGGKGRGMYFGMLVGAAAIAAKGRWPS